MPSLGRVLGGARGLQTNAPRLGAHHWLVSTNVWSVFNSFFPASGFKFFFPCQVPGQGVHETIWGQVCAVGRGVCWQVWLLLTWIKYLQFHSKTAYASTITMYHANIVFIFVLSIVARFSGGKFGPDHPLYISKEEYNPQVCICDFEKILDEISIIICLSWLKLIVTEIIKYSPSAATTSHWSLPTAWEVCAKCSAQLWAPAPCGPRCAQVKFIRSKMTLVDSSYAG